MRVHLARAVGGQEAAVSCLRRIAQTRCGSKCVLGRRPRPPLSRDGHRNMLTTDGPIPHVMMRPSRHLTASRSRATPVVMSAKVMSRHRVMSASRPFFPSKADIHQHGLHVRFVP